MIELADFVVFCVWIFASFVLGVCGMGAAMIAIPVMSMVMPIHQAVLTCCAAAPFTIALVALMHWRHCRLRSLIELVLGSVPGILIGLLVIQAVSGTILQISLSTLLFAFLIWQWFGKVRAHSESTVLAGASGCAAGFFGTLLAIDGPPVAAYGLYAGWQRNEFVATLSLFFFGRGLLTFITQAAGGLYTAPVWHGLAIVVPASILGTLLSIPVARRVRPEAFRNAVRMLILLCALSSLVKALG